MAPVTYAGERYPSARELLAKYGVRAKKSWGQNFLEDDTILSEIARLAAPHPGELVVELGAGLGHLTVRLLGRGARLVAVERDRDMAAVLRGELGDRITLLETDAVKVDYGAIIERLEGRTGALPPPLALRQAQGERFAEGEGRGEGDTPTTSSLSSREAGGEGRGEGGPRTKVAVAGNLPYHLTSPILFSLLDQVSCISRAVLLVQREVAERLTAVPGTHEWGILSVFLQREADVSIETIVPPESFLPAPKIESAVLRAAFRTPRDEVRDPARFRRLVKAGFSKRRKTLGNALGSFDRAESWRLAEALDRAGIDPRRRGETLTIAEWTALERAMD